LVNNSSAKTGKLKTGNVFYYHAEYNCIFQSVYADKQQSEEQMRLIVKKSTPYKSNVKFYFSGALQFSISQDVTEYIATIGKKNIVASPGQVMSLEQTPLTISLKEEMSENIAVFGINDKHYATRAALDVVISLMISNKQKNLGYRFVLFDCLGDEEAEYREVVEALSEKDLIEVVSSSGNRIEKLKQLCDAISSKSKTPTILVILGQEKFAELKSNVLLEEESVAATPLIENEDIPAEGSATAAATFAAINGIDFISQGIAASFSLPSSLKTTQDALNYILDKGPAYGIHSIIQVSRPADFVFVQGYGKEHIYNKCKHVILLRSEATALNQLMLRDDVYAGISKFIDTPDRVRAYYHNAINDSDLLFTPYVLPDKETIDDIINS
jgi:vacuolar-type H+-ATPase subunit F/Vma7